MGKASLKTCVILVALAVAQIVWPRSMLYCYDFDSVESGSLVYEGANKGTGTEEFSLKASNGNALGFLDGGAFGSPGAFFSSSGTSLWLGDGSASLGCGMLRGFTISFWIRASASPSAWSDFFGFRIGGVDYRCEYKNSTSGVFSVYYNTSSGAVDPTYSPDGGAAPLLSAAPGEWKHIALVFAPDGVDASGRCVLYVDGSKASGIRLLRTGELQQLHIGSWVRENGADRNNGATHTAIDELAVLDYPATPEEVKWLSRFRPGERVSAPGRAMPLCWHFHEVGRTTNGLFADNSGTGTDEARKWKHDGYYNWVDGALGTVKAFHANHAGTFTVGFREGGSQIPTLGSGLAISFCIRPPKSTAKWSDFLTFQIGQRYERFEFNSEDGSSFQVYGTSPGTNPASLPLAAETWNHICAVYSKASEAIEFFLNGEKTSYRIDLSGASPEERLEKILVGPASLNESGAEHFAGINEGLYLDEVAIFNHSLSPAQIKWLSGNIPSMPPLDATNLIRTVSGEALWSGKCAAWSVREWSGTDWAQTTRTAIWPSLEDVDVEATVLFAEGASFVNDSLVSAAKVTFRPLDESASASFALKPESRFKPDRLEIGDGLCLKVPLVPAIAAGTVSFGRNSKIVFDIFEYERGFSAPVLTANAFELPPGESDVLRHFETTSSAFTVTLSHDGKSVHVVPAGLREYFWSGDAGDDWNAPQKWSDGSKSVSWADGMTAVFSVPGASSVISGKAMALAAVFRADAEVRGDGLFRVPSVAVEDGVSAAVDVETFGPLVKSGAGTLALGSDRHVLTQLREGTLEISRNATLDLSAFMFSGDPEKQVALKIGAEARAVNVPSPWVLGGAAGARDLFVKEGGVLTASGDVNLGNAAGGSGALVHDGGTMTVGGHLTVGNGGSGELTLNGGTIEVSADKWVAVNGCGSGRIVLNGGTLKTQHVSAESGSSLFFKFDGGTLHALQQNAYTAECKLGIIGSGISMTVGSRGGTIDANAQKNVYVHSRLSGEGAMVFKGGGRVILSSPPEYDGVTSIEIGTAIVLPSPVDGRKLKFFVPEGALADGVYEVVEISGSGTFPEDVLDSVEWPSDPKANLFLRDGGKVIVCVYGYTHGENVWIGGAAGELSNARNWTRGSTPSSGAAVIASESAAHLALPDGAVFQPSSITFPASSAPVTIEGRGAIAGVAAVTNLSAAHSHVINVPVCFSGDIAVVQRARGCLTRGEAHVVFAGGAFAAEGCAIAPWDEGFSWAVFGDYHFANGADAPFEATESKRFEDGDIRFVVTENSSLHVPFAGSLREMDILGGAEVFVGGMELSSADEGFAYKISGEMSVGVLKLSGEGDRCVTHGQDGMDVAVFRFSGVTNSMTHGWFCFGDRIAGAVSRFHIGSGGLVYENASPRSSFCIGRVQDKSDPGNRVMFRPIDSDFAIGGRSDSDYSFVMLCDVEFCTDDESGVGRTITVEGVTRTHYTPKITVSGTGTLKIEKPCVNGVEPPVTVRDTATLSLMPGAGLGARPVTLRSGAVLKVAASGEVEVGGLNLGSLSHLEFDFTQRNVPPKLKTARVRYFEPLKAASFNIRLSTSENDPENNWDKRKGDVINLVKNIAPDVIGFQEVRPSQYGNLKSGLGDYAFFGEGRDGGSSGEASAIAYRKSRLEIMKSGTFWLSSTPDKAGSKKWGNGIEDSGLPRICTWALMRDKASGGEVCVANTHLDLREGPRLAGMKLILERLGGYISAGVPTMVFGDMNEAEDKPAMRAAAGVLNDALLVSESVPAGPWRTYNAYRWTANEKTAEYALGKYDAARRSANENEIGRRIDFIFSSPNIKVAAFSTRNDPRPGKNYYPSDHYPIVADMLVPLRTKPNGDVLRVKVGRCCPSVAGGRRFVLTEGAGIENAANVDFDVPDWVECAGVEDGEIVVYTKAQPFFLRIR